MIFQGEKGFLGFCYVWFYILLYICFCLLQSGFRLDQETVERNKCLYSKTADGHTGLFLLSLRMVKVVDRSCLMLMGKMAK